MVTQKLQVCIKYRIKLTFPAGHCYCPTVWDLPCVQLRDQITGCSAFKICFLFQSLHLVMSSTAKDSIHGTSMHKTPGAWLFTVPWRLMWSNLSFLVSVAKVLKSEILALTLKASKTPKLGNCFPSIHFIYDIIYNCDVYNKKPLNHVFSPWHRHFSLSCHWLLLLEMYKTPNFQQYLINLLWVPARVASTVQKMFGIFSYEVQRWR